MTSGFESWEHNEIAQVQGWGGVGSRSADTEGTSFPTSGPSRAPRQDLLVQFWGPHSPWLLGLCLPGLAVGGEEMLRTGQIYDSAPTPPAVPLCFPSELWGRLFQSPSLNAPLGRDYLPGLEMLSGCPR